MIPFAELVPEGTWFQFPEHAGHAYAKVVMDNSSILIAMNFKNLLNWFSFSEGRYPLD